jgi:hypothetical protein
LTNVAGDTIVPGPHPHYYYTTIIPLVRDGTEPDSRAARRDIGGG